MPLKSHIKSLISQAGPISMSQFMQIALQHPQHGYYKSREPFGVKGDFTTAPEISQVFGELIGIWCADIWLKMGSPNDIQIVEIGPGRGTLMHDLLRATRHVPGFHDSISVAMVETSVRLIDIQQEKLKPMHGHINWYENLAHVPQKPLIVVANELFDALPICQYLHRKGKWYEKMLNINGQGELEFMLSPMPAALSCNEMHLPEGAVLEICHDATAIIDELSLRIKQHGGAALIIDYGYVKPLYKNTISAIGKHKHQHMLNDIGQVDISAHVDFLFLARLAGKRQMEVYGAVTQGEFLRKMGIDVRTSALAEKATEAQAKDLLSATLRLIGNKEDQMGELFKVLAITNGIVPEGF